MFTSKRKYKRFDLPFHVKFKPTYGATQYVTAVTRNVSSEGLCLEVKDFNFIKYENLDMTIELPEGKSSVSLSGDVVWKRRVSGKSIGGIKLKTKNRTMQKNEIENIFASSSIPVDDIYRSDAEYKIKREKKKPSVPRTVSKKSKSVRQAPTAGLAKQYLKSGKCKVTFRLPGTAAPDAQHVALMGDFNRWDPTTTMMKRLKNGDFHITLNLDTDREYRFRYLIDDSRWENDWQADRYVPNDYGSDDSLLIL